MSVVKITKDNFENEVINSEMPVLIDFYADWCGPCKILSPIIDQLSDEVSNIKVAKINVDEETELARKYEVMSIPTLAVFKNGEVVEKTLGVKSKRDILKMVEQN